MGEQMGKITNEEIAFQACICYRLDASKPITPENLMCFSKGVKGFLSKKQDTKCKNVVVKPAPPSLTKNAERIHETGTLLKACLSKQETLEDYDECLKSELEKRTVAT